MFMYVILIFVMDLYIIYLLVGINVFFEKFEYINDVGEV